MFDFAIDMSNDDSFLMNKKKHVLIPFLLSGLLDVNMHMARAVLFAASMRIAFNLHEHHTTNGRFLSLAYGVS